tara:strand:+ start:131 stop:811 length:681 start_codon:yes stop_codon:yes gene_type:complete
MNKLLKKISYDTLLITILVSMLFIYMLITLNDSPVKESFDDEVGNKASDVGSKASDDGSKASGDGSKASDDGSKASDDGSKVSGDGADDIKDGVGDNKDGVSKSGGKVLVERVDDKGETTVINNYYGGNKEMAKFMQKLLQQNQNNLNQQQDKSLMDQGMCSQLNNQLGTLSLAEYKNTRFMDELKAKCAKQEQACKVSPQIDQTALIGTLLTDSKNTRVGDILQQ